MARETSRATALAFLLPATRLRTDTKTHMPADLRTAYVKACNSARGLIFPAIVCISPMLEILGIHAALMFRAAMGLLGSVERCGCRRSPTS